MKILKSVLIMDVMYSWNTMSGIKKFAQGLWKQIVNRCEAPQAFVKPRDFEAYQTDGVRIVCKSEQKIERNFILMSGIYLPLLPN